MSNLKWSRFVPIYVFAFLVTTPSFAYISHKYVVEKDETIESDIIMTGETVRVLGTVHGDLIGCARSIAIEGTVYEDMLAFAQVITIAGDVNDDFRGCGRTIEITGNVKENVAACCQDLTIADAGEVGGDVIVGCQKAEIYGTIAGDTKIAAKSITISGTIQGDANLKANKIVLLPTAQIKGDLTYESNNEVEIKNGAQVLGRLEWHKAKPERAAIGRRIGLFLKITFVIASIIIGIIIVAISRRHALLVVDTMTSSPWKSLVWGFVFLVCVPIATVILLCTIVGIPLAIFTAFMYIIALYVGKIFAGLVVGRQILKVFKKEKALMWAMILGIVVLWLLGRIPYVGRVIGLIAALFGVGALLISKRTLFIKAKEKELI